MLSNNEVTESSIESNLSESNKIGLINLLRMKETRHELLISVILQISQQLSGYYAVIYSLLFYLLFCEFININWYFFVYRFYFIRLIFSV
jgi:hypothetical protein